MDKPLRELLPNVWQWSKWNEQREITFNGLLIKTGDGMIMIDPPAMTDLSSIEKVGKPDFIYITNKHHTRAARAFEIFYQSAVMINEADKEVDLPITGTFMNNDILPGGFKVCNLKNQKTKGESALLWRDILIVGDAVISRTPKQLSLLPAEKYADPKMAKEALKPLLDLEFKHLLLGDGHCELNNGRELLKTFLASDE